MWILEDGGGANSWISRKRRDLRRRKPIRFCFRLGEFKNRVKIEQRKEWRSTVSKSEKKSTLEIEIVYLCVNGTNIRLLLPVLNIKIDRIQLLLKQRIDFIKDIIDFRIHFLSHFGVRTAMIERLNQGRQHLQTEHLIVLEDLIKDRGGQIDDRGRHIRATMNVMNQRGKNQCVFWIVVMRRIDLVQKLLNDRIGHDFHSYI